MGTVVLDSTNLDAIVADAVGEPITPEEKVKSDEVVPDSLEPDKAESKKTEDNPEAKAEDEDEAEDENGLSAEDRKGLTAKMQRAIGKKHRQLKEAEEFAAAQYSERRMAEQKAEQIERELARLKAQVQPEKVESSKPARENFQTDDAYRDAMDDWRVDQKFAAREAQLNQQREQERQAQVMEQAKARIATALELVPDFQEVTEAADLEVPGHIAGYMQKSELFAELGYHFAKHPDVLTQLQKLPRDEALVQVGKIESKLQPFSASDPKTQGKGTNGTEPSTETGTSPSKPRAAAPITPLSSSSAMQVQKDESEMTTREAIAAWQKRTHANLGRRQRH